KKVLDNYERNIKEAQEYLDKTKDEELLANVLEANRISAEKHQKSVAESEEFKRLAGIRETAYQAALPFIDFIHSLHPGNRFLESQTVGGFLAAGKMSKENMFKLISFYNEITKKTGDKVID